MGQQQSAGLSLIAFGFLSYAVGEGRGCKSPAAPQL